mmetsp:Transcript_38173/g.122729  ORF Transcript_38173/g.122729 Transcript_38173/m.122729 type:complete len:503 (-) Transcript_38173:34-1542(-)
MVRPRHRSVLEPIGTLDLFSCLNPHLQKGDQHPVLGNLHLGLSHDEPLAAAPLLVVLLAVDVHATLHAQDRLLELPHRQFLEVVIRLEHDLSNSGAGEPLGLEALDLHGAIGIGRGGPHGVDRVQREERLGALAAAHLERRGEVLQVHGAGRLQGRSHLNGVVLLHFQAAQAFWHEAASQLLGRVHVPGDRRRLPTDVELLVARLLQTGLALQPALLLAPQLADQILCPALTVHEVTCVLAVAVGQLSQGQATVVTQGASLAIGIGLLGLVLRLPRALLKHGRPTQVLLELGTHDPLGLLRHGRMAPEREGRAVETWPGADGGCGLAAAFQEFRVHGQGLLAGLLPLLLLAPLAVGVAAVAVAVGAQVGSTRRLLGGPALLGQEVPSSRTQAHPTCGRTPTQKQLVAHVAAVALEHLDDGARRQTIAKLRRRCVLTLVDEDASALATADDLQHLPDAGLWPLRSQLLLPGRRHRRRGGPEDVAWGRQRQHGGTLLQTLLCRA